MTVLSSASKRRPASGRSNQIASANGRGARRRPAKAAPEQIERLTKRDQLIETAWRLFNREGYHATGIDRILAKAGVAKMTLYKHFRSKEELIVAALKKRSQEICDSLSRFLQAEETSPQEQLLSVFDWLIDWVDSKEFHGCFFQKAMAEYQDLRDPIHQAATAHKAAFYREIRRLVMEAGLSKAKNLPEQFALLVEGAIVNSHATGSTAPVTHARDAAQALIQAGKRIR